MAARGDYNQRDETAADRLDRNYSELLQELRVAQMGVQILFAFLLSIAFQQRFSQTTDFQRAVYYATLMATVLSAATFIAPVATHRAMFRRHLKDELVRYTSRMLVLGLVFLAVAMSGAVLMITDFIAGAGVAAGLTSAVAALFLIFWLLLPLRERRHSEPPPDSDHPAVP
jgi:MFS family permease